MRKKLLALVMCATMVLGTAVTAVAAPLKEDYDNAKKIFKNGADVITEMTTNKSAKKVPVTVNVDLEGGVAYGFTNVGTTADPDYRAVRLNEDGKKALAYIGKIAINKTKKNDPVLVATNESVITEAAILEAKAKYGVNAILKDVKAAYVANISTVDKPAYKVAVVTLNGTTDTTTTSVEYFTLKNADKAGTTMADDADFMTGDLYSYDDSDATLYEAILQTSSTEGSYVYAPVATETGYTETELRTVAYALEAKTLTKDAIALVFDVNQIKKATTSDVADTTQHPYVLKRVTSPVADVTLTLENDWFSNTKLFAKNLKTFRISNTWSSDGKYNLLALVESGLDLSTPYGKFDVTFNIVDGHSIVIFDVDDAAAKDNAGQADADKSTSSPKTGDVAPIAALAVVMMGAFGAMVVASKKRA